MDERTRLRIWDRDDHVCQVCGGPGQEIDHIEEKGMGGRKGAMKKWFDRDGNLQTICLRCHRQKHFGGRVFT